MDLLSAFVELPGLQSLMLGNYGNWAHGVCMRQLPQLHLHHFCVSVNDRVLAERVTALVEHMKDLRTLRVEGGREFLGVESGTALRSATAELPAFQGYTF